MTPDLLIWGAGGHGRVLADAARAAGWNVVGFIDADDARIGRDPATGFPPVVLTQRDLLARLDSGDPALPLVAVGIGSNRIRLDAAARLGERCAPAIVHPAAVVSPTASLDRGAVVFAGVVVNTGARIGCAAIVNSGAIVEHDCVVGDGAHLSPGAVLTGSVTVGRRAWIGAAAVAIPGVGVGDDAIVGAGAVVLSDVPSGVTVVGNPARPLTRRA